MFYKEDTNKDKKQVTWLDLTIFCQECFGFLFLSQVFVHAHYNTNPSSHIAGEINAFCRQGIKVSRLHCMTETWDFLSPSLHRDTKDLSAHFIFMALTFRHKRKPAGHIYSTGGLGYCRPQSVTGRPGELGFLTSCKNTEVQSLSCSSKSQCGKWLDTNFFLACSCLCSPDSTYDKNQRVHKTQRFIFIFLRSEPYS